jgi:hypothetical protein
MPAPPPESLPAMLNTLIGRVSRAILLQAFGTVGAADVPTSSRASASACS